MKFVLPQIPLSTSLNHCCGQWSCAHSTGPDPAPPKVCMWVALLTLWRTFLRKSWRSCSHLLAAGQLTSWKHQVNTGSVSDAFRYWTHFSEWLIPPMDKLGMVYDRFTNIIHVQIKQSAALHVAECFRADTQVRLSSSTCTEILTPTNARCAINKICSETMLQFFLRYQSINPDIVSGPGLSHIQWEISRIQFMEVRKRTI